MVQYKGWLFFKCGHWKVSRQKWSQILEVEEAEETVYTNLEKQIKLVLG